MKIFPEPNFNGVGYNYLFQEGSLGRPRISIFSESISTPQTAIRSASEDRPGTRTRLAITSPAVRLPGDW